jgi:hypothetical protein
VKPEGPAGGLFNVVLVRNESVEDLTIADVGRRVAGTEFGIAIEVAIL